MSKKSLPIIIGLSLVAVLLVVAGVLVQRYLSEPRAVRLPESPSDNTDNGQPVEDQEIDQEAVCGNNYCEEGESFAVCPDDCPAITNFGATVSQTSASLQWQSEVSSTAAIEYGVNDFGQREEITEAATQHEHALNELMPNTVYRYRITPKDADGNELKPVIGEFRTSAQ